MTIHSTGGSTPAGGLVRVNKLLACGHSYVQGQNENGGTTNNRFSSVTAQLLGATETNVAVGGSALCSDNAPNRANAFWHQSGGWVTICQANQPDRSAQPDFSGDVMSFYQTIILMHGLNDMGMIGPPGQNLANKAQAGGVFDTTFPPALRAVISRLRAGHYGYSWNGSDSGSSQRGIVTYDANWSKFTSAGVTSNGSAALPTGAGATATLTLPSWYPGGLPVDLMFVGSLNNQGAWSIAVDGTTIGTCDGTQILATSDSGTREQSPYWFRVPASAVAAAGSHTIAITFTGGTSPYFDSWTIEASTPPLIVLVKQPRLLADQSPSGNLASSAAANYGVKNTDILAFNTVMDALAAEWTDRRVLTVDTDSLIAQNPANLQTGADNLHPSMKGAGLIAQAIAQAVNSYYIAHPADLAQTGKGIS